jgi:hypothetical protein
MTPKDTHADCLTLPVMVVDKAFSFPLADCLGGPLFGSFVGPRQLLRKFILLTRLKFLRKLAFIL